MTKETKNIIYSDKFIIVSYREGCEPESEQERQEDQKMWARIKRRHRRHETNQD